MRNLRLTLAGGLIAALIVACGGGPAATETSSQAADGSATETGGVEGTAHYEVSGDFTASGDLGLVLSYIDGSNPGTASLDFKGGPGAASGSPDELVIRVQPNTNSLVLTTGQFEATAKQGDCTWTLGELTPKEGTGSIACDGTGANAPGDSAGGKKVTVKIDFTY